MVARVTLAEIDTLRIDVADAVERFEELIVPALREQDGYEGAFVLKTPAGKAMVVTFWASPEAAQDGVASGFYAEQIEKFMTFYRAPPGRESYDVAFAEAPEPIRR